MLFAAPDVGQTNAAKTTKATSTGMCDAAAKAKCASANKLDCSSGSTTCGACKIGFKASNGGVCTALAACDTYTTSVTCDRRRCDFWPGPPAECYNKEEATDEDEKGTPIKPCYQFSKTDCEGTASGGRCEWGVEDGVGECWDREATATGEVEGTQSERRRLGNLPAGFTQLENGEVGGPMSQALIHAFFMCDFAPQYDWIEISDWWITSVSSAPTIKIGYALIFPLAATAAKDYGELAGVVGDMLKACQASGKLTQNLDVAAKMYKVTPLIIKSLEFDSTVKINRLKTGRAGSNSTTIISLSTSPPKTTSLSPKTTGTTEILSSASLHGLSIVLLVSGIVWIMHML